MPRPRTAEATSDQKPDVRMVTRPFMPTMTDPPQFLKDYFRSQDLHWNWQRKEEVPNLWGTGLEAVSVENLPAEIQEEFRRSGLKPTAEGWLQRFDDVLCVMPQALYEQYQAAEADRRDHMERRYLSDLEDGIDKVSAGRGRLYRPTGAKATPRSFVSTAKQILQDEE